MGEPDRETAEERGYDAVAPIDAAFERGEISQQEWHDRVRAVVEPAYLSATTAEMGSGHAGTAQEWEVSRSLVMEAVDRSGTFLDVGCANGLVMASVARWRDRIWTANADGWEPPRRFEVVRTALDYVPARRRAHLVGHLLGGSSRPAGGWSSA